MLDRRTFLVAGGGAVALTSGKMRLLRAGQKASGICELRVDYLENPIGLESCHPRLSWQLSSEARKILQSAYRILVASTEEKLLAGYGDLWDTGKVASQSTVGIVYKGRTLQSRQRCWWQVEAWDQDGRPYSPKTGRWEMGLLSSDDWVADWLAVDDLMGKQDREFPVQWMWGTEGSGTGMHKFRVAFTLSTATRGGRIFISGRSYLERVIGLWVDSAAIATDVRVANLIGEYISLGPLTAGKHVLSIDVDATGGLPETRIDVESPKGLAVVIRLEPEDGGALRIASGQDWQTRLVERPDLNERDRKGGKWLTVVTSPSNRDITPSPAMNLRREFTINRELVKARLYVTALGAYVARLNGRRVGDALLTPEVSDYSKRILYRVYDVARELRVGVNVLGMTVGDGWYASHPGRYAWGPPPRRAIMQLELEFVDGSEQRIGTDPDWHISRSAIQQSVLCQGEVCDARLEQRGWDVVGFDESKWIGAEVAPKPTGRLTSQVTPPIRAIQTLKPTRITNPVPGTYVFDFGQNFAGWCRLRIKGTAGTRIDLHFAEELGRSGEVDQFVLLGGRAADTFILCGDPAGECFEPHFAYHGFRYVQVMGLSSPPTEDLLDGVVIHSDLRITGLIRVESRIIQKIWLNTMWSQRSNFTGIPTDCPNRAERLGYMGDAGMFWDAASFNMDVAAFTRRQMDNVRDDQQPDGVLPLLAPGPPGLNDYTKGAEPAWSDGGIILPWTAWQKYGDLGVIEENWEAMDRFLRFVLDNNPDHIWNNKSGTGFGDWLEPGLLPGQHPFYDPNARTSTPNNLIATAYWAHSASLLAQMAEATGRFDDASRLHELSGRVRHAFQSAFIKSDGSVGSNSQTCYILALKFRLVPKPLQRTVAGRLSEDIRRRGTALTTGIVGTQFSLDVLADAGYNDLVYDLLLKTDNPSWGYMIENGATTMWERWDGNFEHRYNEGSHNQYAFGSICGFIFRRIIGIDSGSPGFERILVRPIANSRLQRAGGSYDSVMGKISTEWSQGDGVFKLNVTIPSNTTARIHLPVSPERRVRESRRDVSTFHDIQMINRRSDEVILEVGSGDYLFSVDA
jgi:alpha-L-rhamnosidase